LRWLGLYTKRARILFLGLDNAGKTTLLHLLRDDKLTAHKPTLHPQYKEFTVGQVRFQAYDLGGRWPVRTTLESALVGVDGIVFMVDTSDPHRFEEAASQLHRLLLLTSTSNFVSLRHTPMLVLGSKIDVREAVSEDRLIQALRIHPTGKNLKPKPAKGTRVRPVEVFMCSAVQRTGYAEGFRWLAECFQT